MKTLTSANSVLMIAVAGVFPVPQKIEGYASEAAFALESVSPTQAVMGVDGRMSAGYTPFMSVQTITLQPDSPSLFIFETWLAVMKTAREVFYCNGTLDLSSIERKYTMSKGTLTQITAAPTAAKILQPMTFQITWESVLPSLV